MWSIIRLLAGLLLFLILRRLRIQSGGIRPGKRGPRSQSESRHRFHPQAATARGNRCIRLHQRLPHLRHYRHFRLYRRHYCSVQTLRSVPAYWSPSRWELALRWRLQSTWRWMWLSRSRSEPGRGWRRLPEAGWMCRKRTGHCQPSWRCSWSSTFPGRRLQTCPT
jgi:hypothetical protein